MKKNASPALPPVRVTVRVGEELAAQVDIMAESEVSINNEIAFCCDFCLVGAHASLIEAANALQFVMWQRGLASIAPERFSPDDDEPPF